MNNLYATCVLPHTSNDVLSIFHPSCFLSYVSDSNFMPHRIWISQVNFHPGYSSLTLDVKKNVSKTAVKSSFWGWEQPAKKKKQERVGKTYLRDGKISKHPYLIFFTSCIIFSRMYAPQFIQPLRWWCIFLLIFLLCKAAVLWYLYQYLWVPLFL